MPRSAYKETNTCFLLHNTCALFSVTLQHIPSPLESVRDTYERFLIRHTRGDTKRNCTSYESRANTRAVARGKKYAKRRENVPPACPATAPHCLCLLRVANSFIIRADNESPAVRRVRAIVDPRV